MAIYIVFLSANRRASHELYRLGFLILVDRNGNNSLGEKEAVFGTEEK